MSSLHTTNTSLADEIEAINSIFGADTVEIVSTDPSITVVHLDPPSQPFTFTLCFSANYPSVEPNIDGIASAGNTAKGEGDEAVELLRGILDDVYQQGTECLYDLIEAAVPRLSERSLHGAQAETSGAAPEESRPAQPTDTVATPTLMSREDTPSFPAPDWIASEPLTVMKSTFLAHAARATSKNEALSHVSRLISGSKKIASATHNITAYRIRQPDGTSYIQDCDDDGESAAGGRLLHLLRLMECEDVVVVVTRWFGGVKLGGERFRCIGKVARECLVKGRWGKENSNSHSKGKK